jgi:hypothetical protein
LWAEQDLHKRGGDSATDGEELALVHLPGQNGKTHRGFRGFRYIRLGRLVQGGGPGEFSCLGHFGCQRDLFRSKEREAGESPGHLDGLQRPFFTLSFIWQVRAQVILPKQPVNGDARTGGLPGLLEKRRRSDRTLPAAYDLTLGPMEERVLCLTRLEHTETLLDEGNSLLGKSRLRAELRGDKLGDLGQNSLAESMRFPDFGCGEYLGGRCCPGNSKPEKKAKKQPPPEGMRAPGHACPTAST